MQLFKTFLARATRRYRSGEIFSRRELLAINPGLHHTQVDNYRLHLVRAGYWLHLDRGLYKRIRRIPKTLGWRRLVREAYPNGLSRGAER